MTSHLPPPVLLPPLFSACAGSSCRRLLVATLPLPGRWQAVAVQAPAGPRLAAAAAAAPVAAEAQAGRRAVGVTMQAPLHVAVRASS